MKYADPKVIWLAGADNSQASELAVELQRHCRSRSIPAMVVDESQTGQCDAHDCVSGNGRLCRLAKSLAEQGYPVIVAAGYHETACQAWNRAHLPGYFEVHLQGRDMLNGMEPVEPDMRFEDYSKPEVTAEDIFEEVFGRGQLMPGASPRAILPSAGLAPSYQLAR